MWRKPCPPASRRLAERYAVPLPKLEEEVDVLAARVEGPT